MRAQINKRGDLNDPPWTATHRGGWEKTQVRSAKIPAVRTGSARSTQIPWYSQLQLFPRFSSRSPPVTKELRKPRSHIGGRLILSSCSAKMPYIRPRRDVTRLISQQPTVHVRALTPKIRIQTRAFSSLVGVNPLKYSWIFPLEVHRLITE